MIDGVEYVPADQVATPAPVEAEKSSWRFIKSPVFWKLGLISASALLLTPGFEMMAWYEMLGQFLALWLGPSVVVNRVDRTVDKLSVSNL